MAHVLAVALLTCAFSARAQVIEEGGFPVKGEGISGGAFSLSCPPRLVAQAGEAIPLSCAATGVLEEGVQYRWESVSGDDLPFLSDAQAHAPLFTAPSLATGAEYAYRLTAMASGAYRTATVTVSVEGVSEEKAGAPVLWEDCDPLTIPDEPGAGCAEDRGPVPFGVDFEEEGLFPAVPGQPFGPVPDGGLGRQAPRLECPVAVFLEELETGAIECRVSDASGEEYLDFAWEPVGGTTRDYLENPRLMPEDAPNPSVVAPETPVYETLESFHSGETTFRYRYRLTATSRATGLSSSSEVEVFVSSSRPSVYCPLEIVVEEGETVSLDCEGADPLSLRMDYDEEAASVLWEWEGLWGTSTDALEATDLSSPLFTAPAGSAGKEFHYIASMTSSASGAPRTARRRVTVTVAGTEEGAQAAEDALALANKGRAPVITCNPPNGPLLDKLPYFGEDDEYIMDCSVEDEPSGATYTWTGTQSGRLQESYKNSLRARLDIWNITTRNRNQQTQDFDFTVTLTAPGVDEVTETVTITLKERQILCWITDTERLAPLYELEVDEGGAHLDLEACTRANITSDAGGPYEYRWHSSVPPASRNLQALLTSTGDQPDVAFIPPAEVPRDIEYTIGLDVTWPSEPTNPDNYDHTSFRVTVKNLDPVDCPENYYVYEGSSPFTLGCTDKGTHTVDEWEWDTETHLTSGTDTVSPTFTPPAAVTGSSETFDYTVTAKAGGLEIGASQVSVTVRRKSRIYAFCNNRSYDPFEGEADITLDCQAQNAGGYTYAWTGRNGTVVPGRLSSTTIRNPRFSVPEEVDSNEIYRYTLTASAPNAVDGVVDVTVTVKNKPDLVITCPGNPYEAYEGEDDFDLDCSVTGAPSGSTPQFEWTARGSTANTDELSSTTIGDPTFDVPPNVDANTDYEYRLVATAENAEPDTADVTVTILNKAEITVTCPGNPYEAYEGGANIVLNCSATGVPQNSVPEYEWAARGSTSGTNDLSATDIASPDFVVPPEVDRDEIYEYSLTVSAEGAHDDVANVTVTVKNKLPITVTCSGNPYEAYEGAADITLDCDASGGPPGATYNYAWTGRNGTVVPGKLSSATIEDPTFDVPGDGEVDADETYEYTLTVTAENAEDGDIDVTVRVLDKKPLEVACATPAPVFEGAPDFDLDCAASGAPSGSTIEYAWTPRGGTSNTDRLSPVNVEDPTFDVPETVAANETYEYLLTVSAENAIDATEEVTVTVLKLGSITLICASTPLVYEGSEDFDLDCSISGDQGNTDYAYAWTARGDTPNTSLLSNVNITSPTFRVPADIAETTTYEYLLTATAEGVRDATAPVSVTVLNRPTLVVACTPPSPVYEGSANFALDCEATGAPGGDSKYVWSPSGATANTDLLISGTDGPTPTFAVPGTVDGDQTYEYLLTASAENAEDGTAEVTVTVLDYGALSVTCADPPLVYDGSPDFDLDCSVSGAPEGSMPTYLWTARGSTTTDRLSSTTVEDPTFDVPEAVEGTTTYEYLLTVSAEQVDDGSAAVTVTVLKTGELHVVCTSPISVYEGSEDFALDCSALGAPEGSVYDYAWTVRGSTANTDLLSDVTTLAPTFLVPDDVPAITTYEYLLTVSAENAVDGSAAVTVTVLNREMLSVTCPAPLSVYEGSEDIELDCSALGASDYTYVWTAQGDTQDTSLLSAADIASPIFYVPDDLDATTTYEYLLTASAENAISGTAEVAVTVLNRPSLSVACTDPPSVYEGSEDIAFDCEASGAPGDDPQYTYAWTARGNTSDTSLLSDTHIATPVFYVPDAIDVTTTYEYLLTASAENAVDGSAAVAVTVLNKPALAVTCADPGSVYEEDEDIAFDCSASGAPGDSPQYAYAWTARGDTQDTSLLSATDIASPTFATPEEVAATTTYEYLLTVSAENAEDGSAEVTVTVLDELPLAFLDDSLAGRVFVFTVGETIEDILLPEATGGRSPYTYTLTPVLPPGLALDNPTRTISGTPSEVRPETEYAWQVVDAKAQTAQTAFFIEVVPAPPPPVAELLSLGVTISASSLNFGVQSADTEVSLDPMTDRISTYVSGPYHRGRMTLSPDGSEDLDENGEMNLSIELASPIVLRREGGGDTASIDLAPNWSLAESCGLLSSQTVGGLYTEVTLSEDDCRLLRFGGELDLTDVLPGRYAGSMDLILRSGEREEMHSVAVSVTVVPAQQVITIGPGGVRFSTSRELPAGLTEEQNLSIYPHVAFLAEETPHGVFELSNPSLVPLEVSVSARFGYTEATEQGREVVVEDVSESHLGDLSEAVDIHPGVLVLMPGEKGFVRYGVTEEAPAAMAERGYAAFFDVVSQPRQYADRDQMPGEVTGDHTARVTMRVPGVYVPGEGASQLRATLLSISFVGPTSATFLVETADRPFAGEVVAYDGDGRELGRRETLVYTRSRVRILLDHIPEEGPVVLRFSPRGSGRAPEPASVEWNAPGRDIGAAGDKDRTRTPETLVQKP